MAAQVDGRAVVLGGSIAGLLTARVLADHFRQVTVVDRDRFPAVGRRRSGVPQDRHVHLLHSPGQRAIDQLFPGSMAELAAHGAVTGEMGSDSTQCFGGRRIHRVDADLDVVSMSRPLLEGHLRSRLATWANVTFRDCTGVHGVALDEDRSVVTGVRLLPQEDGSAPELLRAELTVDAMGRGSRLPRWLADAGFPTPSVEESGLEVSYTSGWFPRVRDDHDKGIVVAGRPPDGIRGGVALTVEGDCWLITLVGLRGEQASTEPDAFVDYAATLPIPEIHDLVCDRELLSELVHMRFPTGRRVRHDRMERFPGGLVVVGDAMCSFNPVYGQGMTVAAQEALALADCLEHGTRGIAPRFFRATRRLVDDAWDLATNWDASYLPHEVTARSGVERLAARLQDRTLNAAARDPVIARHFMEVVGMVRRPTSLLRPDLLLRILTARPTAGEPPLVHSNRGAAR